MPSLQHQTISEVIAADYQLYDAYCENIKNYADDGAKVRWRNKLVWLIALRSTSKELVVYPALEKIMGQDGKRLERMDKTRHLEVKQHLDQLQSMTPVDPRFFGTLDTMMDLLRHHIDQEKKEDLPRLESALSREESRKLARRFQRTKSVVPTRSHPSASISCMFETLSVLKATPVDAFSDSFTQDLLDAANEEYAGKTQI